MLTKMLELSRLSRETVGASCSIDVLKNGSFRVRFPQEQNQFPVSDSEDPEQAVQFAIDYIKGKRRYLKKNEQIGVSGYANYTMRKAALV